MALWLFILLQICAFAESRPKGEINQTDLHKAMADMRMKSYRGFVILLQRLSTYPDALYGSNITFLMPDDRQLSKASVSQDNLQDFILSHSIPMPLLMSHLIHFPNRTLIPTCLPNRMISITNNGRSGMFVNKARIVNPDVCLSSLIRCHGISDALMLDAFASPSEYFPHRVPSKELKRFNRRNRAKSAATVRLKRTTPLY
ncbi:fasciclin-like arabinogalactan protein 19 [Syzygium oleosum]|uniref:fasciclin-like arabinogalactan protein 19 n=1 Tax=Syzygium oleosum TaxID=219896 RepID=UPI0024BA4737|nr:fasciclin-like arabinogalactan protein 19 [Syzygium oleosum]